MPVRKKIYPASDTGIFRNPEITVLSASEPLTKKEKLAVARFGFRPPRDMDRLKRLLNNVADLALRIKLEELRKADPKGTYELVEDSGKKFARGLAAVFRKANAEGSYQHKLVGDPFLKTPAGKLINRRVLKLVRDESGAVRYESVPISPDNYTAADADFVRRKVIEILIGLQYQMPRVLAPGPGAEKTVAAALSDMYHLGWYARQVSVRDREPDAKRGRKVLEGAKHGHTQRHGTAKQKQQRWAQYQEEVDRLRAAHPTMTKTSIRRLTGKKFGVDPKTIWRHTRC